MVRLQMFSRSLGLLLVGLLLAINAPAAQVEVPTPRKPVTDQYYEIKVTEDYRWLENAADPAVREWTAQQNARTRAWLDRVPVRNALAQDLRELYKKSSDTYSGLQVRSNMLFITRLRPPAHQPVLLRFDSITRLDQPAVVVDPNQIDRSGAVSIDWYTPSHDGKWVAVCLSRNGSEDGSLHFFDAATGKKLPDEVPRVQYPTGGGSAAWNADATGIFYTRYPHKGERAESDLNFYQQVWFHKLGTPASADTYETGRDFPRIAEIDLEASEDGAYVSATVANGDGGDYMHWLRDSSGRWQQITRFEDAVKLIKFGRDQTLYMLSRNGAPRGKILQVPRSQAGLRGAKVLLGESKQVIQDFAPADHGIYVQELIGGPSQIRYFDAAGKLKEVLPMQPVSSVGEMAVLPQDELIFRNVSFTEPFSYKVYHPKNNSVLDTSLAGTSPADFSDINVRRVMVRSKDGTQVPMTLLFRKGTRLSGKNPVWLRAYGGYGISVVPSFDFTRRLWFDAGGVMAIANLRGGGEFGEVWHKAGNLTRKQNVFDDFIACAEWLISNRYTSPEKLAIEGGSNGGLLMGAVMTQRPHLFRAVVSSVGIYDMLRVELEPNGAFNITEFGTVKNRPEFDALYRYSPYHRVKDGTAYPAMLLITGENDGRVNPYNSRKMAARLQAATSSDRPILLRTSSSTGHGIGSSMQERIAEKADVLAFLIDQLGADQSKWHQQK